MVKKKRFREDLYYRLNVVSIEIPSLKERKEDIPYIIKELLERFSKEMDKSVTQITPAAMDSLMAYNWPGNIRELENVIERAFNLIDKDTIIMLHHLPFYISHIEPENLTNGNRGLKIILEEVEKNAIEKSLTENEGNKYRTAKDLRISRTSLYEKIQKYKLEL